MSTVRLVIGAGLIGLLMLLSAVVDWAASFGRDGPVDMFDY